MPTNAPQLVDAQELAKLLGVNVNVVYRLSGTNRIPRYRIGHRTIRFDYEEVKAALRLEAKQAYSPVVRQVPKDASLPSYDWSASKIPA